MKKNIKITAFLLVVVMLCATLTACPPSPCSEPATTIPTGHCGVHCGVSVQGAAGSPAPRCLGGGPGPFLTWGFPLSHCLSGL